ncbi:unnamed protein product, partial [Medioppia subpectinata]
MRSTKLKQRLAAKAAQFEANSGPKVVTGKTVQTPNKSKIKKLFKDLSALSADNQITGHWPTNMTHSLERNLNELEKLFRINSGRPSSGGTGAADSLYFHSLNGVQLLTKMLSRIMNGTREKPTSLTDRSNAKLAELYELVCGQHLDVADYVLQSQHVIDLLDILCHRINLLDTTLMGSSSGRTAAQTCDIVVGALTDDCLAFNHIIQDVISYIVSVGMIDKLSLMMANTRGPVDDNPELTQCLRNVVSLFSSLSKLMALRVEHRFGARLADDDTQLMLTFQMTHIGGVVSLIYGVLLH